MPSPDSVPFVDLDRIHGPIADELQRQVNGVLERGDFILGGEVDEFEREFAEYVGTAHCVGVGSGTAALAIALQAMGIGPGDEVIVPAHTFVASALAVRQAGAEPVLCDVEAGSGLVDLDSAGAVCGPRTAALMLVHLYGQVCDMQAAAEFADSRGIAIIEDAAQAHGATWDGARAGGFGIASAFSFYPSKNLGAAGDAGAICTNDEAVAARARRIRNLGQERKGEHVEAGVNERLDTIQAAVLRVKLRHLDEWNASRRAAAEVYRALLPESCLPAVRPRSGDVFHLYPVLVSERDHVAAQLEKAGISTGVHYWPALHEQPPLRELSHPDLPNAERWAAEQLSLPMFAGMRREEAETVAAAFNRELADGGVR